VQLESGKVVTMDKLHIGDRVLVAPGQYSEVYLFTHRLPEAMAEVVKLSTDGAKQLRLTPNHYVYVNGTLAAAHVVQPGDKVTLADGTQAAVVNVTREMANGLFNPHTLHGDVVVDGIITSTYTQGIAPGLAHAALWPVRALYQAGINVAEDEFASGSQTVADLLPNGRNRY
jgi:preprotein translocase subunit YajC